MKARGNFLCFKKWLFWVRNIFINQNNWVYGIKNINIKMYYKAIYVSIY